MELAHEQGAGLLALRAALDLAQSLAQDGLVREAVALLTPFAPFVDQQGLPEAQRLASLLPSLDQTID